MVGKIKKLVAFKLFIKNKRGQAAMEYLFIVGIAALIVLPLTILFFSEISDLTESMTRTQIDKASSTLAQAANEVYYLGEPSQKTIKFYMPNHIESVDMAGNNLTFVIAFDESSFSVRKYSQANLTGNLSASQGTHTVQIIARANDVLIRDKP